MPAEIAEDRAAFVNVDEFGTLASYTPSGGPAVDDLAGIFDDPHLAVQLGEATTSDSRPTFTLPSENLPPGAAGDAGDTLTIDATVYDVVDLEPDGTGMTRIILGK